MQENEISAGEPIRKYYSLGNTNGYIFLKFPIDI